MTDIDDAKAIRDEIGYLRANVYQRLKDETEARGFLGKRVRKLEKQNNLLIQAVLIGASIFGFSQISHYWKLGEWWNVLALIGFGVIVVKVFSDSQKDN